MKITPDLIPHVDFHAGSQWRNRQTIIIGSIAALLQIIFFFAVKDLKSSYVLSTHFFNQIILLAAVATSMYCLKRSENSVPYLAGLVVGLKTAVISAFVCNFCLLFYFSFINSPYFLNMRNETALGEYMTPIVVCIVFFTEQVAGGLIFTLIAAQLTKLNA